MSEEDQTPDFSKVRIRRRSIYKTFTFAEDDIALLVWLKQQLNYRYDVAVIRKSLENMTYLVKTVSDGGEIIARKKDGKECSINKLFKPAQKTEQ